MGIKIDLDYELSDAVTIATLTKSAECIRDSIRVYFENYGLSYLPEIEKNIKLLTAINDVLEYFDSNPVSLKIVSEDNMLMTSTYSQLYDPTKDVINNYDYIPSDTEWRS
jgi:hypothetical protein